MRAMPRIMILTIIVAIGLCAFALLNTVPQAKQFSSYAELTDYLEERSSGYRALGVGMDATQEAAAVSASAEKSVDYSTTNIQVAGVDEPDIVKTDGKYIYTTTRGNVTIIDANPADSAKIVSTINTNEYVSNIFINGDKLVVFGNAWQMPILYEKMAVGVATDFMPTYYTSNSFIYIYDVSDHSNPVLVRNITLDGNYYDARMIGDYVYAIATESVQILDSGPVLPVVRVGAEEKTIQADEITYFDNYDNSFSYTYMVSINTQDDSEEPNSKVFLLGYTQNIYVSPENVYFVYTKYISESEQFDRILDGAVIPNAPLSLRNDIAKIRNNDSMSTWEKQDTIGEMLQAYVESIGPEAGASFMKKVEDDMIQVELEMSKETEKTVVNKISVSGADISYSTSGEVPGRVLNQFSMDEKDENFRIATTTGNSWDNTSMNHMYVLDNDLHVIGRLENLARGESIFSVRFMGDRAYMVTFKRTDPLFVIDLSQPRAPTVLGELKMPGFSEYLHPYDEGHLIGIGQQTDENGRATGQVKLSLFDVTDVSDPKEVSTYLIGNSGDWAYSEALYDHKAFLFSQSKNLLVIPVSVNNWEANKYEQGAYIFNLNSEDGFGFRGMVTHVVENASEEQQYYDYSSAVKRALYIDDALWTISEKFVNANNLSDLSKINSLTLA